MASADFCSRIDRACRRD